MRSLLDLSLWAATIEFIGALIIVGYVAAALVDLARMRGARRAQLRVADGVMWGLSFKLAGTLLKTILLHTWEQVLFFVVIFTLRTVLKRVFAWEAQRLQREHGRRESMGGEW